MNTPSPFNRESGFALANRKAAFPLVLRVRGERDEYQHDRMQLKFDASIPHGGR